MKTVSLGAIVFLAGSLLAAQAAPADDVAAASQKLAGEPNYSWHTSVVMPPAARFRLGPIDGQTQTGGPTYLKVSLRDNTYQMYLKGAGVVVDDPDPDGGWQTLADFQASDDEGPGRFLGYMTRNFKLPAAQAADLVADCGDIQETNGVYAASLTPDGVTRLLRFRDSDTVSNPSGSARFWINNGELTKFEYHAKGAVSFNGRERTIDRDTTVEIKDVGTTKMHVPNDVKKLLP